MRRMRITILLGACLLPVLALAKGEGVGLWMEGSVSNVKASGPQISLVLTGRFWFEQYRGNERATVEVDGRRGIAVTVTQAQPFFAMTTDWGGGALREHGALLALLEVAAQRKRSVKFELVDAHLVFAPDGSFTVLSGGVDRATDGDLR